MSTAELIRSRRTIHHYTNEKVSEEIVHQALELGLWAPNHKFTFPWRWVKVGASSRLKIAELAIELKAAKSGEPLSEVAANSLRQAITQPSHYLALSMVKSSDTERLWEDFATMACSVEIISLALWEKGIGTKWTTSGYSRNPKSYQILNIDPSTELLVGGLFIGKPAKVPEAVARPQLSSFLRSHD